MSMPALPWTATGQQQMRAQLVGFWGLDVWDLKDAPIDPARKTCLLHFDCASAALNVELKYACWWKFSMGICSVRSWKQSACLHRIIAWLNYVAPTEQSLIEHSLTYWETSLRSYLLEQRLLKDEVRKELDASQQIRYYRKPNPILCLFRSMYKVIAQVYDERDEYEKDVWDLRILNIPLNPSKSDYRLNFSKILQDWLRQAVKQYIRYCLAISAAETCRVKVAALNVFSHFLHKHIPAIQDIDIDRSLILAYISHLSLQPISVVTRGRYLALLRDFLHICTREQWLKLSEKPLIYDEDIPFRDRVQPRFIPQEILDQLNHHLDNFPPAVMRMVLILQECGMRISELCAMPLDCMIQDAAGDWFLRWYQPKMRKEHSIPISREIVAVIQEQQQAVHQQWGQEMVLLFPSKTGKPFKQRLFTQIMNRVAYERGICDSTGKLYHFQSHQFRHTVGTRLINNGVPQHIVQRYLGHESPAMTARYAHIHDQTLKEEFAKFRGRTVDITGKVVEQSSIVDSEDLQWMKKNVLAQTLPNGMCALPLLAGACPHANACLDCGHFRTDARFLPQHREQLQETQRLIQVGEAHGWQRQVEMNRRVATNLERIIITLEDSHHDA